MDILLDGGALPPYNRMYLKKSGDLLPTENYKVVVFDGNGKPKFFQNIARDITERIKAEQAQNQLLEEIKQSNEQLRSLALRLLEVQELERKDIAAELHDRVGQNLTGLNLNLKILQNQLSAGLTPEAKKRLDDSLIMVEETTHKIRDVMADLNPPVLDEYGLMAAIKWYSGSFSDRTGVSTRIHGGKLQPRLSPSVERIVFRLVQESLNNVAKHAQATLVVITVASDKKTVSLSVKDNGVGFDSNSEKQATAQPHWGFLSMQKRAASIGADFSIDSTPGKGTQVSIKIRREQHGN
jgi:two-component system sensor histidine kinase UhpB